MDSFGAKIIVMQTVLGFVVVSQTVSESYDFSNEVAQQPVVLEENEYGLLSDYVRKKPMKYSLEGTITKAVIGSPLALGSLRRPQDGYWILKEMMESATPIRIITPRQIMFRMVPINLSVNDNVDTANNLKFNADFQEVITLDLIDQSNIALKAIELYRNIVSSPRNLGRKIFSEYIPEGLKF